MMLESNFKYKLFIPSTTLIENQNSNEYFEYQISKKILDDLLRKYKNRLKNIKIINYQFREFDSKQNINKLSHNFTSINELQEIFIRFFKN